MHKKEYETKKKRVRENQFDYQDQYQSILNLKWTNSLY